MPTATRDTAELVPPLRDASRKLVRQWGFLRPTLAESGLSPAAVHCLIEIGDFGVQSPTQLLGILQVLESELDHTIGELESAGDVRRQWKTTESGDTEQLFVPTERGLQTLAAINAWSQEQVSRALAATSPDAGDMIIEAFKLYASAMQSAQQSTPSLPLVPVVSRPETTITVLPGYRPGILGRCLEMHMYYYSRVLGWGAPMEAHLAQGFGDMLSRISSPLNEVWAAIETSPGDSPLEKGRIVGTIWIDGENLGMEGVGHLRGFILDETVHGRGIGRKMMDEAMAFVRKAGFREVRLWTVRELLVARRMYEKAGFVEVGEHEVDSRLYGRVLSSMEYCWKRPVSEGCIQEMPS
jgi:GNAT superfamily N-acetyltransferase/DNA-binding MarR family transcriptional regulator